MSKSIYNSLKFLETTDNEEAFHVLHVQNKSQSQQNKLIVKDRSGNIADHDITMRDEFDYSNPNNQKIREQDSSTVYLATKSQATASALRPVTVNKLIYDFITGRLSGVFPPFDSLNMAFNDGAIAFELTGDPQELSDEDGFIRFPIILNVPQEDAELALATLDPASLIANPRPVVSVREDEGMWDSLDLNSCLFKTPDGLWWLAFASKEQHYSTYTQLQYGLKILLKSDGDLSETLREATLHSFNVTILAANYDPCAGATREVVMQMEEDVPFVVKVGGQSYQFANLEDFRVNAHTRLPANITAKLLNKFIRPDISCAGATSSTFISALPTDRFNVYIGDTLYKDLTYAEFVALMKDNDCVVTRMGSVNNLT